MRDLNIDFMDLYKRTDRFIKDAYSSSEGVSEYIRLMEADFNRGSVSIRGWKSDYDNLKHIRWIRNQLAHEIIYDSDICSETDYEWLEEFYKSLFSSDDPLAALRKLDVKADAERVGKRQTDSSSHQAPGEVYTPPQSEDLKKDTFRINYPSVPVDIPPQRPDNNNSDGWLIKFLIVVILSAIIVLLIYMFS